MKDILCLDKKCC